MTEDRLPAGRDVISRRASGPVQRVVRHAGAMTRFARPGDNYGMAMQTSPPSAFRWRLIGGAAVKPRGIQSVERRRSAAPSDFAASEAAAGLTESSPALSTFGVSTLAVMSLRDASAERALAGACSERGRATARAISIWAAP